jgi:hypothetical protein
MTPTRTAFVLTVVCVLVAADHGSAEPKPDLPAGWQLHSPRDEIPPAVSFDPRGDPDRSGAFTLTAADAPGQHGWVQKTVPVTGGKTYHFETHRKTLRVESPRRSAPARIVWLGINGKPVATIYHTPSGKSPQANAEEFAPLLAKTAEAKADLVVLGETVNSVGVGKKPHEVAEGAVIDCGGGCGLGVVWRSPQESPPCPARSARTPR